MKSSAKIFLILCSSLAFAAGSAFCADAKAGSLTCVGLYSETSDGYVSSRQAAGKGDWVPIKVGDVIPAAGEIKINVDRDWVEFIATGKPAAAYEIVGPGTGELVMKAAEVLKTKARAVSFPKGTVAAPDPKFKDKLVVTQYLGRQIYKNANGDSKDIKYGDVLDIKGKVRIIAINNTINLMNASSGSTTVIGPLNFTVEQVLTNKALYKYLNVQ
jgi:hypothetical protein